MSQIYIPKENTLTKRPLSEEMKDVITRMGNGIDVSVEEINNLPEIKEGFEVIKELINEVGTTSTASLPNREFIRQQAIENLKNFGSVTQDAEGNTHYDGEVACERRIDIIIGLPSSGKSSVITDALSKECKSMVIDNDEAKKQLFEFRNGWGGDIVHAESGMIEKEVLSDALKKGKNIVIPKVGSDYEKLVFGKRDEFGNILEPGIIQQAKDNGYTINVHYVDLEASKANGRMLCRFLDQGRWMPPDLISNYGNKVSSVYEKIVENFREIGINGYSHWDNDVPFGERPILLESYGLTDEYIKNAKRPDTQEVKKEPLYRDDVLNMRQELSSIMSYTEGSLSEIKNQIDNQLIFKNTDNIGNYISLSYGTLSQGVSDRFDKYISDMSEHSGTDKMVEYLKTAKSDVLSMIDTTRNTAVMAKDMPNVSDALKDIQNNHLDIKPKMECLADDIHKFMSNELVKTNLKVLEPNFDKGLDLQNDEVNMEQ